MVKVACREYDRDKKDFVVFEGEFLQWGIDYEEFESGPGCHTVAIVKKADGQIEMVYAACVKFLNPPKSESGNSQNDTQHAKATICQNITEDIINYLSRDTGVFYHINSDRKNEIRDNIFKIIDGKQ